MSVTAAAGFVASGVSCGIKAGGELDLALVATDDSRPVPAAAVFTTNLAAAAPVVVSRAHLLHGGGQAAAVVLNSGNANAATGVAGREHAEHTCSLVAGGLGCAVEHVLVCSTGLIGIPLPFDTVAGGVGDLVAARRVEGDVDAARAILTTDTVAKVAVAVAAGVTVGGMAKGAAMLAPNMATMLAVLTTDGVTSSEELSEMLSAAVDDSFNVLSVDGCTSTNDTVMVLASGRSGRALDAGLLADVCASLAGQMAADAEGATRVARVRVEGAASASDARRAARRVAESQLVKCSLHGADPYWGRVVSELGTAGVSFDPDRVSVAYGGVVVCRQGVAAPHDRDAVAVHLSGASVEVLADLGLGPHGATVLTTDLGPGYVAENMTTS